MRRWTGREALPRRGWFGIGATLLLVLTIAGIVRWHQAQLHQLLNTDEADYVRAAEYGLLANYLGTRERSGFSFAAGVRDEYRRTGWARPFKRDWDAGDASALRHYHPPLSLYPVALMSQLGIRDERLLRLASAGVGAMACLAAVLLTFLLLQGVAPAVRITMSATAGLIAATSPYHALSSVQVGPHAAYSLVSTLMLVALSRATQVEDRRWWLAACALFGLALLTVPYWALLAPAALWVWCWGLPTGARSLSWLLWGMAAAAGALLVAWPPFLVEASFVKPVLMYAGIVLKPLGSARTSGSWISPMLAAHMPLLAIGVIGLLALVRPGPRRLQSLAPTAIFVLAFVLLNLRVSHMKPLYAGDVVAPLAALVGALAGHALSRFTPRFAVHASLVLVVATAVAGVWRLEPPRTNQNWRTTLATLDERFAGQRVLVTPRAAGAMVTYYLDRVAIVLDSNHPEDAAALDAGISSKEIDAILRWGGHAERGGVASRVISTRSPDGKADIDGTTLSWWLNER